MVCAPCRQAGHFNQMAKEAETPDVTEAFRNRARYSHDKCTGKGCSCQHYVGPELADPAKNNAAGAGSD